MLSTLGASPSPTRTKANGPHPETLQITHVDQKMMNNLMRIPIGSEHKSWLYLPPLTLTRLLIHKSDVRGWINYEQIYKSAFNAGPITDEELDEELGKVLEEVQRALSELDERGNGGEEAIKPFSGHAAVRWHVATKIRNLFMSEQGAKYYDYWTPLKLRTNNEDPFLVYGLDGSGCLPSLWDRVVVLTLLDDSG